MEWSMKIRSLISEITIVFDSKPLIWLIWLIYLHRDIKVWTETFVLKICENCPKTDDKLWYKLDKAHNAY